MSTLISSKQGLYIHEDIQSIETHFNAHGKQKVQQKLSDRRYHKDYCDLCYPPAEFGRSEIFEYFLTWANEQNFAITAYTGKSTDYYINLYRLIIKENYTKDNAHHIIKKLLKSFAYSTPRSLHSDTTKVFTFIVQYCKDAPKSNYLDILNTEENPINVEPQGSTSKVPNLPPQNVPDNWEQAIENTTEEKGKGKADEPESQESLTIEEKSENEENESSESEETEEEFEDLQGILNDQEPNFNDQRLNTPEPETTYGYTEINALENQYNALAAWVQNFLENNAILENPEDEMENLATALQAILEHKEKTFGQKEEFWMWNLLQEKVLKILCHG